VVADGLIPAAVEDPDVSVIPMVLTSMRLLPNLLLLAS
jgi:hypothetical protein